MSSNVYAENDIPVVSQAGGYITKKNIKVVGGVGVVDFTGAASVSLGSVSQGAQVTTATSANAFTVGSQGITNPALNVDTSGGVTDVTGINLNAASAGSGFAITTTSSGTNENLTIDAKGSGTVTINGSATGIVILPAGTTIGGSVPLTSTITSSSATAFQVGPNGATNPAFLVNASGSTGATGLSVTNAAAGSGATLSTLSSATNENLVINSKGTGTVTIGPSAGNAASISAGGSLTLIGALTAGNTIAITAGGNLSGAIKTSSTANFGLFVGSGAPTISAAQGSIYLRSDGSSTSTRLYVATNNSGTWTNVTTAA